MLLSLYEFLEDLCREGHIFLRVRQQLRLHVYRKHMWHFEGKERLVKACSLRHGLQRLLAWSVSGCMCFSTNRDVAAQCTTNITWHHSQTTWIPFKICSPPVSAVGLFHVEAVALLMFDFLQLNAVYWLGLHQLITCKSSEHMLINTDLTVHLYMFRHLRVQDQENIFHQQVTICDFLGFLSGVVKDSVLLGQNTALAVNVSRIKIFENTNRSNFTNISEIY